jgi:hypothetical protein
MGVAKIPPPRPSTAEPDHAPQTISEDASLTPPPRQASVTSDERESPCPNRRLTNASRQASVILTSAFSHVLIDRASILCSSASSPPTSCRLGGRQPAPPVVHLLQMALGKGDAAYRCSRFTLTTVSMRSNRERRGMFSSTVLTPRALRS